MKNKGIKKKRKGRGATLFAAALLLAASIILLALPADARFAIVVNNGNIEIVSGIKVSSGIGTFIDSNPGNFDPTQPAERTIDAGRLSEPATVAWDSNSIKGTLSLKLRALDDQAPDAAGGRYRYTTLSRTYDDQATPIFDFSVQTWLPNIEDTPPPSTGEAAHVGFDLDMNPIINVTLRVNPGAPYTGAYDPSYYGITGYHYEVYADGTTDVFGVKDIGGGTSASFALPSTIFAGKPSGKYWIQSYAYNGYTAGHGTGTFPQRDGTPFSFVFVASPGGKQSYTIDLQSSVPTGPGINFISMPFAGPWYAFGADGTTPLNVGLNDTNELTNAYHLVRAINAAARAQGTAGDVASTFGSWESTTQQDGGVLIPGYDASSVQTALGNITLQQAAGYQVYIGDLSAIAVKKVSLVIKNTQ